jgi:hypothetical protein
VLLSERGPDAHEWQPCSVEVCYSYSVPILTSEGAALPHIAKMLSAVTDKPQVCSDALCYHFVGRNLQTSKPLIRN